jgi:DNA-binding beta-propeller fold protein YncE
MKYTLAVMSLVLFLSSSSSASTSNGLMDISADGKLLACSNRDTGTVTIVDLTAHTKLREIRVGEKPEGVSFLGSTSKLAVAVYAEDKVVIVEATNGGKLAEIEVFDEPYGVVSDPGGERLYVTLDYPGRVIEIDAVKKQILQEAKVGKFIRGIALSAKEQRLFVTEYYTAKVKALDAASLKVVDEWHGASTDNLARQLVLNPRREKVYLPNIRSRITAVHGEGSIFPYISVVDTAAGEGKRRKRIPMDAFLNNLVTSNPWEIAVSPNGRELYVVFAGTDDMFACKVLDDDYREIEYRQHMKLGANPRAVRVAPNGETFYVYNALDFNVVAYDTKTLKPVAEIAVTENPLGDEILQGKRLFYSALQPMVGRRWISCSSCHPDGEPDRRTWHNPEGLRNTQSFAGMAWTHPIHWSADRDEVQDFEHTIRGPLMQGRGLIRGQVKEQLGAPNKGLSKSLDAVAAYSNSHKFTLSPYAKRGLSDAAQRGREVFFSAETQCATCHSGPFFADSRPRAADDIIRHDVGTSAIDPGEKMGPAYDTPTLLGVYRTAPYLHHGKAETLSDVITTHNQDDKHGKTSHLTSDQGADLVAYLKSLPYEDPIPAAKEAGLTKVER